MGKIHATAIVDSHADLDKDVEVGPYSLIGPNVKIAKGTRIKSHVVIEGNTTLGEGNTIFQYATVGSIPQDLKYKGEDSQLIIGSHNTIREFASLNPGTEGGGMVTRVGNDNLLMMYCHIAHDCMLGSHNVIANGATLGGHVVVDDFAIVGGLVGIHQFVRIGTGAILGAGSMVSKDVPPYCNATGDRAKLKGLNMEGLRRKKFDKDRVDALKKAYHILFRSRLRTEEAIQKVAQDVPNTAEVQQMIRFIEGSKRGVCRQ